MKHLSDVEPVRTGGRHRVELEPYAYRWFRVGGMHQIEDREES